MKIYEYKKPVWVTKITYKYGGWCCSCLNDVMLQLVEDLAVTTPKEFNDMLRDQVLGKRIKFCPYCGEEVKWEVGKE
jgi:hypothetical protein